MNCSCCQKEIKSIASFTDKGEFFYCRLCGIYFFKREGVVPQAISDQYFDEEYKDQYGKTYLEDFDHIKAMGEARLGRIRNFDQIKAEKKRLLDIGCAYGPFLAAAKDAGYLPFGQDLSSKAVEWVKKQLQVNVTGGDFLSDNFPPSEKGWEGEFDVVSLWYVIEHFENPCEALEKINRLLKSGGILAFSTPSGEGISAFKNLKNFLKTSPDDHYSVWKPSSTKRFLKKFGFQVEKIVITGHHPERIFPSLLNIKKKGFLWKFGLFLSLLMNWGDTYEVYARKTRGN